MRLEPLLSSTATPMEPSTITGSSQDCVVSSSTMNVKTAAKDAISGISVTVLVVATAVETAAPDIALSSPMTARMVSTTFSSSRVSVMSALPSLQYVSTRSSSSAESGAETSALSSSHSTSVTPSTALSISL